MTGPKNDISTFHGRAFKVTKLVKGTYRITTRLTGGVSTAADGCPIRWSAAHRTTKFTVAK